MPHLAYQAFGQSHLGASPLLLTNAIDDTSLIERSPDNAFLVLQHPFTVVTDHSAPGISTSDEDHGQKIRPTERVGHVSIDIPTEDDDRSQTWGNLFQCAIWKLHKDDLTGETALLEANARPSIFSRIPVSRLRQKKWPSWRNGEHSYWLRNVRVRLVPPLLGCSNTNSIRMGIWRNSRHGCVSEVISR